MYYKEKKRKRADYHDKNQGRGWGEGCISPMKTWLLISDFKKQQAGTCSLLTMVMQGLDLKDMMPSRGT